MKMPNGNLAVVEDAKLADYCLSPTHPRGRHKARLFAAALGFSLAHVNELKAALLAAAARDGDCTATKANDYGTIYEIIFDCRGPLKTAPVLSVWIIEPAELFPRLVTCYPV